MLFLDGETGEKLTFNSATNTMGPRKFLHYGTLRKVSRSIESIISK